MRETSVDQSAYELLDVDDLVLCASAGEEPGKQQAMILSHTAHRLRRKRMATYTGQSSEAHSSACLRLLTHRAHVSSSTCARRWAAFERATAMETARPRSCRQASHAVCHDRTRLQSAQPSRPPWHFPWPPQMRQISLWKYWVISVCALPRLLPLMPPGGGLEGCLLYTSPSPRD